MKIVAVCQSGLGTSFMMQMNIEQVLEDEGLDTDDFTLDHTDVGSVSADMADYFVIESTLAGALSNVPDEKIKPLKIIVSLDETKDVVNEILDENNISHK